MRDNTRGHIDEKYLNNILNETTLAITESKNYVSDQFAIHCGKRDSGQAASFHFGTVKHSSSKGSTINHTFEQRSQAMVTMNYQVQGANKGSKFAHCAGVEPDKKAML